MLRFQRRSGLQKLPGHLNHPETPLLSRPQSGGGVGGGDVTEKRDEDGVAKLATKRSPACISRHLEDQNN